MLGSLTDSLTEDANNLLILVNAGSSVNYLHGDADEVMDCMDNVIELFERHATPLSQELDSYLVNKLLAVESNEGVN